VSLLFLSFALAVAAAAPDEDVWDTKETREIQAKFGECVIKRGRAAARKMVLDPSLEGKDYFRAFQRVGDGWCLLEAAKDYDGVEMRFPMDTMRYALAEALVRGEFFRGELPSIKDASPLVHPTFDESKYQPEPGKTDTAKLEELELSRAKRIGVIFLSTYGECIVRTNPGKSHALLMTNPSTPEESAAFKALTPEFSACLPKGQQLAFGKTPLRGTIAMNFYRLAHAPRLTETAGVSK
jgi:hypothetical protein